MILSFTLSMPNNNSWNGKWSGDGKLYVQTKNFKGKKNEELAKRILNQEYYSYHWDDGWTVRVTINKVNGNESRRLNRKSLGFYGYDWMINSIIKHNKIII